MFLFFFFMILFAISELTYVFIEKKFTQAKYSFVITALLSVMMMMSGGYIYVKAGVVRDVPELDIYVKDTHRGMHAEYVDRIYMYDKDFAGNSDNKYNVLIHGNSFGRDMANVLLESQYKDSICLSYIFDWDRKYLSRIKSADYIFTFSRKQSVPDYVWHNLQSNVKVIGIGTKNYGYTNGQIYAQRWKSDYTSQTVELHPWYKSMNDRLINEWKEDYINFIQLALTDSNHVRVFTDNGKNISQDCCHLTQAGAKWYADKIDFSKIFKR